MNYEKNLRIGRHIKMYDCVENNRHGAGTKLLKLPGERKDVDFMNLL